MWFSLGGFVLGALVAWNWGTIFYVADMRYTAVALLCSLDAILGGVRALLEKHFDIRVFVTSVVANALLAALLTYLGDLLSLDLYLGAVVAFSIRMFNNLTMIRVRLLERMRWWQAGTAPPDEEQLRIEKALAAPPSST